MEPTLLLPLGFGTILVNIPLSGAIDQVGANGQVTEGALTTLFNAGIANELFPLILFIGIGAMIDFGPVLSNPKLMIFGAAAQFGIFFTLGAATLMGFELKDAASIAVIGAADGPTSIFVANFLESNYLGAIIVAAYSYMALVPIIQPPVIRLLTTIGLIAGAFCYMTGFSLLPDLAPLEDAMAVVSSIGIVLLGSLPTAELLQRVLKKPLSFIGRKTGMNDSSAAGLLMGIVSPVPAITMMEKMDERGKIVNAAFLVSAASTIAAHMGFTFGTDPDFVVPLLVAKLAGGIAAVCAALFFTKKSAYSKTRK